MRAPVPAPRSHVLLEEEAALHHLPLLLLLLHGGLRQHLVHPAVVRAPDDGRPPQGPEGGALLQEEPPLPPDGAHLGPPEVHRVRRRAALQHEVVAAAAGAAGAGAVAEPRGGVPRRDAAGPQDHLHRLLELAAQRVLLGHELLHAPRHRRRLRRRLAAALLRHHPEGLQGHVAPAGHRASLLEGGLLGDAARRQQRVHGRPGAGQRLPQPPQHSEGREHVQVHHGAAHLELDLGVVEDEGIAGDGGYGVAGLPGGEQGVPDGEVQEAGVQHRPQRLPRDEAPPLGVLAETVVRGPW